MARDPSGSGGKATADLKDFFTFPLNNRMNPGIYTLTRPKMI